MKIFIRVTLILCCLLLLAAPAFAQEKSPVQWSVALAPAPQGANQEAELVITARIAPGWIVYSTDFKADLGPQPTQFHFDTNATFVVAGPLVSVNPKRKKDKTWDTEFGYFEERAEFRQKIKLLQTTPLISGRITGQLCNERDGSCTLFDEAFKL